MSARARHSSYAHDDLFPGERIGRPLGGGGGKALLKAGLLLSLIGGAAWSVVGDTGPLRQRFPNEVAALSRLIDRARRAFDEPGPATAALSSRRTADAKPAALEPPPLGPVITARPLPTAPPPPAAEPVPLTTAALPSTPASPSPAGEPLEPPKVDPSNPDQVRAAAVGLHPELSPVLLARLSPTDYRNAGYAIETAVKETPDAGVFVWPRQRKPELAVFSVRFVAGAAPSCRRYVVTVVKDGWLTTAMPMERCSASPPPRAPRGPIARNDKG
jgi:hypothetical protein